MMIFYRTTYGLHRPKVTEPNYRFPRDPLLLTVSGSAPGGRLLLPALQIRLTENGRPGTRLLSPQNAP